MANTRVIIGLDYELFFGSQTGTPENCMIVPTDAVVRVLEKHGAKLTLFVDAGYLLQLRNQSEQFPELARHYSLIVGQLKRLTANGHDIQLHIHPHWEDSHFDGKQWTVNTQRYRLQDFDTASIFSITQRYVEILKAISGKPVTTYRAGGWCMQPFELIAPALAENGIKIDSTVYKGGISEDPNRGYDFRNCTSKPFWNFESDPLIEDVTGSFREIPISTYPHSPWFFWKMMWVKKFSGGNHASFGDGYVMPQTLGYYIERLTSTTWGPVSIDGVKASMLTSALKFHTKNATGGVFNIMGHPKSLTPYSIDALDKFLTKTAGLEFITFQDV